MSYSKSLKGTIMKDKYKIYVLEKPFSNTPNKKDKKFLGYLLSLRMYGYSAVHGYNIMPIDKYDYLATNILLYKEVDNEIIPLACSRILRYSDCKINNVDFPPLELLKDKKNQHSKEEIIKTIDKRTEKGLDVTFDSAFTISPEINSTMESQKAIKYILGAVLHWHNENNENCFFASATIKVKTDRLFNKLGLISVADDSEYQLENINDELALMMKFKNNHTKQAKKWMESSRSIWEERE